MNLQSVFQNQRSVDYYVENGIIYIQTVGRNLDDENDPVTDY